jgi:hypothetical protein
MRIKPKQKNIIGRLLLNAFRISKSLTIVTNKPTVKSNIKGNKNFII